VEAVPFHELIFFDKFEYGAGCSCLAASDFFVTFPEVEFKASLSPALPNSFGEGKSGMFYGRTHFIFIKNGPN
jgi:hypothetical protein